MGLLEKNQGFFNQRMEDLGVQGYERGKSVTAELEELRGRFESLEGVSRRLYQWWKKRY